MDSKKWVTNKLYSDIQEWITPDGMICLVTRPSWCDRGRFHAIIDFRNEISLLLGHLSNQYYFDEDLAKQELENWLDLAIQTIEFNQVNSWKSSLSTSPPMLIGTKDFQVFSYKVCTPFRGVIVNIQLNQERQYQLIHGRLQSILHLDDQDGFPRYYLNPEFAQKEAIAWLSLREQL